MIAVAGPCGSCASRATRSGRRARTGSRDSRRIRTAATAITAPSGTLIRKIHRQLAVTSSPPIVGPSVAATAAPAVQRPTAAARRSGGNSPTTRPSDVGIMSAAPTAWTTRAATSHHGPGAAAQRADAATKTPRPVRKTRLRPRRSARRPAGTSNAAKTIAYPLRTHDRPEIPAEEKSSSIAGKAMLTTKRSRLARNAPAVATRSTCQ